uniref:Putative ovule protein n=1 Tax=Solanum chacoense TaxID=4108 RepID=A0A0V0GPA4_SOLCH
MRRTIFLSCFLFFHLNYLRINNCHLNKLITQKMSFFNFKKIHYLLLKSKRWSTIVKFNKPFTFTHKNCKL